MTANSLLYWFCLDNANNQALAFEKLESFVETLADGVNSHLVIKAIFNNNEKLMRLCPRSLVESMSEHICKDGKFYE